MAQSAKQYNEELLNFYDEQLLAQADIVYRFAFMLTLNTDAAWHCVRKTFRELTTDLTAAYNQSQTTAGSLPLLLHTCWKIHQHGAERTSPTAAGLSNSLQMLTVQARAAVAAVDIVGLSSGEAARALQCSETDLRLQLAVARRTLMADAINPLGHAAGV